MEIILKHRLAMKQLFLVQSINTGADSVLNPSIYFFETSEFLVHVFPIPKMSFFTEL